MRRRFYSNKRSRPQLRGRYGPPKSNINPAHYIKKAVQTFAPVDSAPKVEFAPLAVDAQLKQNIIDKGYLHQTPIQEKTIQHILEGKDVVGVANTGTGKTAAFLIPLLDKVAKNKQERAIIIVPTRELAQQIRDEIRDFSRNMGIYSTLAIGGASIRVQMNELRRSPHFVIGTPGRLKDLIERKSLSLGRFGIIVLDEVDRMLDMGFIQDIRYLISHLPQKRQSLFFSATLSSEIKTLIQSFAPNHIMASVTTQQGTEHIEQDVVRINGGSKIQKLQELLKKDSFAKVLVFVRTKRSAEKLSRELYQYGFKVSSIHGDKPQSKRTQAVRLFEQNAVNILVATDVASRGIDIADITHVINYDPPATREDYIHRIGRTGRAEKKGTALTFID